MASFAQLGNDLYTGKRSFDIVGRRKLWYTVSAVLIVVSLIGLFGRGINFGIEFRGGSELRVSSVSDLSDYEARASEAVAVEAPEAVATVTLVGSDTIRVQTGELPNQTAEAVRTDLAEAFGVPDSEVTSSFVGPSWGETVTTKAVQALIVFLLLVSLVLAIYFRTWKMAAAALVALLHDLAFTVGIYALLGIEVSPASMIGFLTILGYSIYDTIVVFDKVRENTEQAMDTRRMTYAEAANRAVNQTIIRSINTSVVALLPVGTILVVGIVFIGPGTLLDLAAALFIGIAVGTYSSIFVATPLLVHLREGEDDIQALDKAATKRATRRREHEAQGEEGSPTGEDVDATTVGGGATSTSAAPGQGTARQVHPYAQRGPRNQPKRPPKSRR
ncbi:protein translocase subunit SecF [Ornithinimicrobium sediminis]|uniref:protein translocase subunit SecF n=1 Tax=Ornithinimicrobium sediminis TaxID=2904603 RepID=UPI001E3A9D26|nr:protein translocase subunit SecF [Ornithinimicrobium sediminis]MCE0487767.1 protein translocase subunit SecF [Ornithinimicrobium sediminis]